MAVPPIAVHTFVVPLDGSSTSERALPVAIELAARCAAAIDLVRVIDNEDDAAAVRAELKAVAVSAPRVTVDVLVGPDAATCLGAHVSALVRPVVCMASHGRGRSAAFVGSVASDLVAAVSAPVVMVGPRIDDVAPWLPAPSPRAGVVVCVDPKQALDALVGVGLSWGARLREPVEVVTVAEPVPAPMGSGLARRRFGPDGDPEGFLESLITEPRARGAAVSARVLWDPISPADGVRAFLREHPTTLVIVDTHASRGVARMFTGSVAASIVHTSPAPVLVAHATM
jgi:nucleotide-binding universal stress UspA family protein